MTRIKFQIEIQRVLDVLSKEIYDSPYALLRENLQNAYDAILMRAQFAEGKWSYEKDGLISVNIDNEKAVVADNGIGMSEEVLQNNYWKAGSSGKKTELAIKSGAIGRFGIGGMANFGVCTKLRIETESIETRERIVSEVERHRLSLTDDCITIERIAPTGQFGTKITATLDPDAQLQMERARNYLITYVQYLPVKVELNGELISQKPLIEQYRDDSAKIQQELKGFEFEGTKADVLVQCNEAGRVSCALSNIFISGEQIGGEVCLRQDVGHLWGLRSFFGLAPLPISSYYSFGGVANLSVLSPTAGREALTRESIELTSKLMRLAEECSTKVLATSEICNRSTPFMSHILATNRITLADKLTVRAEPVPEQVITLGELSELSKDRKYYYYEGSDETILKAYGTPDAPLIVLARSGPRRQLESLFIQQFCKMEKVADTPRVLQIYQEQKYEISELSFIVKARHVLGDEYALENVDIKFADLTHNLPYLISSPNEGPIKIYIQRNHRTIQPILKCYTDSYDVFLGIMRDYIRVHIYPQVRNRVPSSTKEGADALQKVLRKRRELYEIRTEDVGFASLLSDFAAGEVGFEEVVKKANAIKKIHKQEITEINVGSMESEIPDLTSNIVQPPSEEGPSQIFKPLPPIMRIDINTDKKLLMAETGIPALNNFQTFLAISDRAFREEYDFFVAPHTTRIIWGGHRIIFIFTHASGSFSLYYDVEIFEDTGKIAGGGVFSTTTILTKRRIFIPIPDNLRQFFELVEGKRKFYVRFDTILS